MNTIQPAARAAAGGGEAPQWIRTQKGAAVNAAALVLINLTPAQASGTWNLRGKLPGEDVILATYPSRADADAALADVSLALLHGECCDLTEYQPPASGGARMEVPSHAYAAEVDPVRRALLFVAGARTGRYEVGDRAALELCVRQAEDALRHMAERGAAQAAAPADPTPEAGR